MIPDSSPESVFSRVYNNMRFERRRIPDMPFLESYFINGGEVVGSVFASELAKSYRDEAIANSPYRIVATPNTPIHAPAVRMYRVVSESEHQPDWDAVRTLNTAIGATDHHTLYDGTWKRIGGDWTLLFPEQLDETQVQP